MMQNVKLFLVFIFFISPLHIFAQFNVDNRVASLQERQLLNTYTVGGREQRVRVFVNNMEYLNREAENLSATSSERQLHGDPLVALGNDSSRLGAIAISPTDSGLDAFSGENTELGLIVDPHLFLCGSALLSQLKEVSTDLEELYKKWSIDEINIFLYLTETPLDEHYKLEIAPVAQILDDPALNIQIPLHIPSGECLLTSDESLKEALQEVGSAPHEGGAPPTVGLPSSPTLAPVEINGKYGFIDKSGRVIIPLTFEAISEFLQRKTLNYPMKVA